MEVWQEQHPVEAGKGRHSGWRAESLWAGSLEE